MLSAWVLFSNGEYNDWPEYKWAVKYASMLTQIAEAGHQINLNLDYDEKAEQNTEFNKEYNPPDENSALRAKAAIEAVRNRLIASGMPVRLESTSSELPTECGHPIKLATSKAVTKRSNERIYIGKDIPALETGIWNDSLEIEILIKKVNLLASYEEEMRLDTNDQYKQLLFIYDNAELAKKRFYDMKLQPNAPYIVNGQVCEFRAQTDENTNWQGWATGPKPKKGFFFDIETGEKIPDLEIPGTLVRSESIVSDSYRDDDDVVVHHRYEGFNFPPGVEIAFAGVAFDPKSVYARTATKAIERRGTMKSKTQLVNGRETTTHKYQISWDSKSVETRLRWEIGPFMYEHNPNAFNYESKLLKGVPAILFDGGTEFVEEVAQYEVSLLPDIKDLFAEDLGPQTTERTLNYEDQLRKHVKQVRRKQQPQAQRIDTPKTQEAQSLRDEVLARLREKP